MTTSTQPFRVVVDTRARTPPDARVLDRAAPTLIAVAEEAAADHLTGLADVLRIKRTARGLDLDGLLDALYTRGVRGVFLEGGPTLAGSFIAAGLVDRVVGYVAPAFLGAGKASLQDAGISTIDQIRRVEILDVARSGPDLRIVAGTR